MVMKPGILVSEGRLHRQSSSLKISCRILRDMKVEAIESFQNIVGKGIAEKGLSHEMDLAFNDMYVRPKPKQGTRPVLKF